MKVTALCHTCRHQHNIDFDPYEGPGAAFGEWQTKHAFHDIDYVWPERSYKKEVPQEGHLKYLHNADIKLAYAATAAMTITLASLATSSTLLVGRNGTAITNASNKYLDYLLSGKITTGTSPTTAKSIELWVIGPLDDTPTWPDGISGTDAAATMTSRNILSLCGRLHSVASTSATSNEGNPFSPVGVAGMFNGVVPVQFNCFVTHDTAVNLNSTGSNHYIKVTGTYATAI